MSFFTPGRQEELLTKDSYIHIDVSNSPFTELGEVLLEKRQDEKVIFVSDSKYTSSISSQKSYSVILFVIVVVVC